MSKYEIDVWEYADEFKNLDTNETFYGYQVCELLEHKDQQISDLEAKLAESEKQIKDAREAGNMAVDSWCKNRRKYEAQIAEMQNKSFILYSMLYETLEKQGCENVASQIDQMTGWTYDKEADWLKGNRNYDQLKQQLAESENQCRECKHLNKKIELNIKNKLMAENCELQKQLAEKEKEIEDMKFMMRNTEQALNNVPNAMAGQRKRIDELTKELKQTNQDKISFAVEQLKKVKSRYPRGTTMWTSNITEDGFEYVSDYIDNQINELKEMG